MGTIEFKTVMVIHNEKPFRFKQLRTICRNGLPLYEVTEYLKEIQESKSERTLASYTQHLFYFQNWLQERDIDLQEITTKVLKNYLKYLRNSNQNPEEPMGHKEGKVLSQNTVYQYGATVIRFIEWCMSPDDQMKLLKKVKGGKITRRTGMLSGIRNITEISELKELLPKKVERLPEFLRLEQIVSIRKWVNEMYDDYFDFPQRSLYLCAFEILIGSGVRKGELVSLQLDCLDSVNRNGKEQYFLKLPFPDELEEKYGKELLEKIGVNLKTGFREIPITAFTAKAITTWKAKRPPEASHHTFLLANIHPDRLGHYFTIDVLRNLMNQINNPDYGVGIEQKVYPHIFRHSYATELINLKVPLDSIQHLMGHASIDSTQIYTHLDNTVIREHLEEKVWGNSKFFGGY